jgi:DNA-binding NarL/FixJ family response regulator
MNTSSRRFGPGRGASCSSTPARDGWCHDAVATRDRADGVDELLRRKPSRTSRHVDRRRPRSALLTDREHAVLDLVARGRSNAEIAAELYIEPSTVKTHLGNVLAKLGLRHRIQVVIYAYENGLITPAS